MNEFLKELILPLFWFFFFVAFTNDKKPILAKNRIDLKSKDYFSELNNVNQLPIKNTTAIVSFFLSKF